MKLKRYRVTIFSAVLAVMFGVYTYSENTGIKKDIKAQYLKGGDFSLFHKGEKFNLSDLKGHPVILYFGYTHCPDVCPVGLTVIRDALNSHPELKEVKALFVTLDPERDDGQTLSMYTQFFHKNILGLTGSLKEIKGVAGHYGTYFRKSPDSNESDNYSIEHTAYFYVINKEGVLMRVMDHDTNAKDLSEIVMKML